MVHRKSFFHIANNVLNVIDQVLMFQNSYVQLMYVFLYRLMKQMLFVVVLLFLLVFVALDHYVVYHFDVFLFDVDVHVQQFFVVLIHLYLYLVQLVQVYNHIYRDNHFEINERFLLFLYFYINYMDIFLVDLIMQD